MTSVAVLYAQHGSIYLALRAEGADLPIVGYLGSPDLPDSRAYMGPYPVVAHPPCAPWGRLRGMSNGADRDCGIAALNAVTAFGGCVEQPAWSTLFRAAGVAHVPGMVDRWGGRIVPIPDARRLGGLTPKPTWVYMVGVPQEVRYAAWRMYSQAVYHDPGAWCKVQNMSKRQREATPGPMARYLVYCAARAEVSHG